MDITIDEYFRKKHQSIADGMRDVAFDLHDWGYVYSWGSNNYCLDHAFIFNNYLVGPEETGDVKYVLTRAGLTSYGNHQFIRSIPIYSIDMTRDKGKAPFFERMEVKQYSFSIRKSVIDIREMITKVAAMQEEKTGMDERVIGVNLHLMNGTIYTLLDDGNLLAFVQSGEFENITCIEAMGLNKNLPSSQRHLLDLVQHVLAQHNKKTIIYLPCSGQALTHEELTQELNFETTQELSLWKIQ